MQVVGTTIISGHKARHVYILKVHKEGSCCTAWELLLLCSQKAVQVGLSDIKIIWFDILGTLTLRLDQSRCPVSQTEEQSRIASCQK